VVHSHRPVRARSRLALSLVTLLSACAGRYAPAPRCPAPSAAASSPTSPEVRDSERVPVGDAPRLGPAAAPITVVVFSDFECPFCARGRSLVSDLRAQFEGDVRVVWRNFPLPGHRHARQAAEAAMEVRAQRGDAGFWRYHDILFAHQEALELDDLVRFAEMVGADGARLRAALEAGAHRSAVDGDIALGTRLGVDGTPAFVVNGTLIAGAQPYPVFEALGAAVLRRAAEIANPADVYAVMTEDPLPAPPPPRRASRPAREPWEPVHDAPVPADAPSLGPADAPVVLQVFSDFECGFCARLRPTLEALRERFGGQLRVVWRDLPLERHANALRAAEAAREVRAQRGDAGFWRFHDALFAHQDALETEDLARYAAEVGADPRRLRAALADHRHEALVRADIAAAQATGIRLGTPMVLVNGHAIVGARPLEEFVQRVQSLLPQTP
jgi:protein-disulfide isomerase